MDWGSFIGPAVVAAVVSGIVSVFGLIVSTRAARAIHTEKLAFDRELAERKVAADIDLAKRKLDQDRALAMWERRSQFAEGILPDCYRVQEMLSSLYSLTQMNFSIKKKEQSDEFKVMQSLCAFIEESLDREGELFNSIRARTSNSAVLFGREMEKDVHLIAWEDIQIRRKCISLRGSGLDDYQTSDGYAFIKRVISSSAEELRVEIDKAVVRVEAVCQSVLGSVEA